MPLLVCAPLISLNLLAILIGYDLLVQSCISLAANGLLHIATEAEMDQDKLRHTVWAFTWKVGENCTQELLEIFKEKQTIINLSKTVVILECGPIETNVDFPDNHVHGKLTLRDFKGKGRAMTKTNALHCMITAIQQQYPGEELPTAFYLQPRKSIAYDKYAGIETPNIQQLSKLLDDITSEMTEKRIAVTLEAVQKYLVDNSRLNDYKRIHPVLHTYLENKFSNIGMATVEQKLSAKKTVEHAKVYLQGIFERLSNGEINYTEDIAFMNDQEKVWYVYTLLTIYMWCERKPSDNIPALLLRGASGTGKSGLTYASSGVYSIANDASGVGRFWVKPHCNIVQLNDWTIENINEPHNRSVIRAYCLGEPSRVKIHSDTVQSKPKWLIMSTNDTCTEVKAMFGEAHHGAAWRRRFVDVAWRDYVEYENNVSMVLVNKELLKAMMLMKCMEIANKIDHTKKMFKDLVPYLKAMSTMSVPVAKEIMSKYCTVKEFPVFAGPPDSSDDDEPVEFSLDDIVETVTQPLTYDQCRGNYKLKRRFDACAPTTTDPERLSLLLSEGIEEEEEQNALQDRIPQFDGPADEKAPWIFYFNSNNKKVFLPKPDKITMKEGMGEKQSYAVERIEAWQGVGKRHPAMFDLDGKLLIDLTYGIQVPLYSRAYVSRGRRIKDVNKKPIFSKELSANQKPLTDYFVSMPREENDSDVIRRRITAKNLQELNFRKYIGNRENSDTASPPKKKKK